LSQDSDEETGDPEAAAYESKSGGSVDTLNGLLDKASAQLDAATKEETTAKNNYDLRKQSLKDEIKYANKDMDAAKKGLAESGEIKAAAKGDLGVTTKDLNNDTNALGGLHQCVTKAEDFEPDIAQRSNMRLWQCSKLASCCSTEDQGKMECLVQTFPSHSSKVWNESSASRSARRLVCPRRSSIAVPSWTLLPAWRRWPY
jgi:hypothetical protein